MIIYEVKVRSLLYNLLYRNVRFYFPQNFRALRKKMADFLSMNPPRGSVNQPFTEPCVLLQTAGTVQIVPSVV
jgi:hypothetical protein